MVTLQIATLKKYKVPEIEYERIKSEIYTESEKITRELKEVQTRNDCTNQLMKAESVGIKNFINDTCDKTKSFINEKFQKLTESENRVCQTVIHSGGRLEDKLTEQQNEIRTQNVELKADFMEENRKLTAEVIDVKTTIKELTTILIGYIGKQKVDLVINTEQIEKSTQSPDKRKVDMTAKICQTFVTEDKENEIIENLPPEVKSPTYNDCSPEPALTDTIEITGKRVNSIILELKATPGILHSVDNFKAAILTLVQVMQTAGGIDVDIEDTVTVNLKFESPLTEDQFVVVKCFFANKSNNDSDTIQLSDECSSISDEYLSTADVEKIESHSEPDIYSQKDLEVKNSKLEHVVEGLKAEISNLKDAAATSLVNPFRDDIGMISKTGKLRMKQNVSKSDDFSSLVSENTYDLLRQTHIDDTDMPSVTEKIGMTQKDLKSHGISSLKPQQTHYLSSKTVDECRNCYEKDEMIIQLDRRLCEIRRRVIEAKKQSVYGNNFLEDLLHFIHQNTNMTNVEEKGRMKYKELKSVTRSHKLELISDVDERDLEKKANKKLMESQTSQGRMPELDQTEEKSDLSLRISEIRREYASSYYTKTDKQKGLGIIVQGERSRYFLHARDPDIHYLQEFFEEIGFVSRCIGERDYAQLKTYMIDQNFYCIFIVLTGFEEYEDPYQHFLSQRSIGKPVIIMTDYDIDFTYIRERNEENEILIVMPIRQRSTGPYLYYREKNVCNDFVKATRRNRFADIMDILTRMNALYEYPIITFQSSLKKKFCFL